MLRRALLPCLALALAACSGSSTSGGATDSASSTSSTTTMGGAGGAGGRGAGGAGSTGSTGGAGGAAPVDKTAGCVKTFGQAIASVGFARFDGTVVAVLPPGNTTCEGPNKTHIVLEERIGADVYRMVMSVDDLSNPGTILSKTIDHAFVGPAWADGWHTGVTLDYVADLGLHSTEFTVTSTADALAHVTDALTIGAKISVFATAEGEPTSAHLVHRTKDGKDGALVVDVDGAPRWYLFTFGNYTF